VANQLVVISWRDIPAQVNAQAGRRRHQVVLDERFQQAIDRAAIVAGKTTAQDYVAEWRRVSTPCEDDLEAVAAAEAERLDRTYPPERLDRLAANGGQEPAD
jgi:Virulence factor